MTWQKNQTLKNHVNSCNNNEHTFSKLGNFIIIEQLQNLNTAPTETLKLSLRERSNFLVKKLDTLTPYNLKQEFNWCYVMQCPYCLLYLLRCAYRLKLWHAKYICIYILYIYILYIYIYIYIYELTDKR